MSKEEIHRKVEEAVRSIIDNDFVGSRKDVVLEWPYPCERILVEARLISDEEKNSH